MFHVDNSGEGNCMYYAYSISLMYFLRAKNSPDVTENIFNTLNLKEDEKVLLRGLLSKDREFSSSEIKRIIEPILGKATRNLAAEYTKKEFKSSPIDSPLFSSAHYGLEYCFKCSMRIKDKNSEMISLIDHEFDNQDYTEAEIYKVEGMDMEMQNYSIARLPHVIDEFNRQWGIKELEFIEQNKVFTGREIQSHKAILLDKILRRETIEFFLRENDQHLDQYVSHLQQEGVWGSEETLFVLHRAIQGERFVRNQEGRTDILYDREIILHLYRNDRIPYDQSGSPEIIVNNKGRVHWTSIIPESIFVSKIPESIFVSKLTPQEQRLYQLLDDMQAEYESIPKSTEMSVLASSEWINTLRNQLGIMKDNPSREAKEKAIGDSMQLLGKMMLTLSNYSYWRVFLKDFFSALLECIPTYLADKKITSEVTLCELLMPTRRRSEITSERKELSQPEVSTSEKILSPEVSKSEEISIPKEGVSKFSQHTMFKKPSGKVTTGYPPEIAQYVREEKQTGPSVARVLKKMYQLGLKGNEEYSPERCRELAQQYLSYVKSKGRHFVLDGVISFIKEMDEVIKQKEENAEEFIEHISSMKH